MEIGATILMIVLFPLNSVLLAHEIVGNQSHVQAEVDREENSIQGIVKGIENKKKEERPKPKAQAVDDPIFQPVRKEGVKDLAVPGAHASVVIDADSGTILHYDEGRTKRQVASLTKLMTAVLVVEKIKDLKEIVTVDEEAVYVEGTKIGCPRSGYCVSQRLRVGEKISAENLLQAMLMNSANDAAVALSKHVSGSQEEFVEMMNKKAKDLGLKDTSFCTASGLEIEGHESECYSTAYDIARIAAYSMRHDVIWKMLRTPSNLQILSADGKLVHTIINTDLALDKVPNLIGGKTGFTPLAGYSLLMAASDPMEKKHRIVAVVLDDRTRWQDIKLMIDWAFSSYVWK